MKTILLKQEQKLAERRSGSDLFYNIVIKNKRKNNKSHAQ
jgi:hypothetical protein